MNAFAKPLVIFAAMGLLLVSCRVKSTSSTATSLSTTEGMIYETKTSAPALAVQTPSVTTFPKGWSSYTNANEITDMMFDQAGYLWAASAGGVTRWDLENGSYERYTVADGLPSNNVTAIQPASDGSVWIGTRHGEIARLEKDQWQSFDIPELTGGMIITDIHQDKAGNIWFSTYGAGAIKYDGQAWRVYLLEDGIASVAVFGISEDSDGNLWFETRVPCCESLDKKHVHAPFGAENGIKYGVSKFDGESWEIYLDELGLTTGDFTYHLYTLGSSRQGLWVSSSLTQEVMLYDGNEVIHYPLQSSYSHPVIKILEDEDGNIWFAVYGWGVVKFDGTDWTKFDEKSGLLSNALGAMAMGTDGAICFGTQQGISCLEGDDWHYYLTTDVESSLPSMRINDLAQAADGSLWLATDRGIAHLDFQGWQRFTENDGLPSDDIRNISVASNGIIWIRSLTNITDFISSYDGKKWTLHDYGDIDWFIDFAQDGAFWTWNYDEETLNFYNGQQWEPYPTNSSESFPEKVVVTSDSQIWVQSSEVLRFNGKTWDRPYPYNSWTTGMTLSPSGNIWLASDIREKIEGQTPQPLHSLSFQSFNGTNWELVTSLPGKSWVYGNSIVFSSDGALWVYVDDGVYTYFNNEWTRYTIQDGLSGNAATAIYATPNGALWFVTEGGLTLYNASN